MWQIASTTGWRPFEILWRMPFSLLMLMTADAPRMVEGAEPSADGKKSTVGIFQTMLNAQQQ